ncbi:TetR/AcrR family transcriptional regulator [Weissella sagaensis]|jgi:AcrR family transcriptional regulator|uniref:TetR/AcrR family transcriptional regulator n=1 Tax=Weissella sagaensis TaxID=2559928 RepID=A0ABW1RSP9_9LACO|nr:TetR/AcrR family transcriptional regulator [Weissella sagaensis]MBU7568043.1 TetR/AcrR family transcriptional regulator [Weissella hellenica]QDJ58285.1 TetR/AcrR family transcriptional regulator [Weissella hellenica]QEA57277.1 TetR/AcrR family transcriptional regulator [Weissella hellenica]UEG66389.1 TetR/AcrR family transcriptional regulator [Weissella hellenica]
MTDVVGKNFDEWLDHADMPNGKREILKATIKLLAEQGYQGTSTAMIAREAGLSEATIFKHFKTKKILLNSILQPLMKQLLPNFGEQFINHVQEHATTIDDLIAYVVRDRYYFLIDNYQVSIILLNQILVDEKFGDDLKQTLLPKLTPGFKRIQHLLDVTDDIDPQIVPSDIVKLVLGQFITHFLGQYKLKLPQEEPEIVIKKITTITQRAIRKN